MSCIGRILKWCCCVVPNEITKDKKKDREPPSPQQCYPESTVRTNQYRAYEIGGKEVIVMNNFV